MLANNVRENVIPFSVTFHHFDDPRFRDQIKLSRSSRACEYAEGFTIINSAGMRDMEQMISTAVGRGDGSVAEQPTTFKSSMRPPSRR